MVLSTHTLRLAAGASDPSLFRALLPWLLLILGGIIVGGIIIFAARRLLQPSRLDDSLGFTLSSLRDLHASGQISDEEFERARASMIKQVQRAASDADAAKTTQRGRPSRRGEADTPPADPATDDDADNNDSPPG